jgi:hypothetical protein
MTLISSEASPALRRQVLLECLREFAQVRLTVNGACMEPALRDGDVVTLVAAARRPPRLGDVVLAAAGDGVLLHRLVWAAAAAGAPRPIAPRPGMPPSANPT